MGMKNNNIDYDYKEKYPDYKFDPDRKDLNLCYENPERTNQRLHRLAKMGLEELSETSFGIQGVVGGLYIERVWNYCDEDFDDYLDWMQSVIDKKK
jgi:hypothetical protein